LRLSNFEETDFNPDCEGIDLATEQFTNILIDTCARSLKVACPKKKPRKHKLWFDKDCALLRKNLNLLSNKKHRNPYDANLRHDYHTTRKAFKKLIKGKKLNHLNSQIEELINHKDSHKFWDYLKSLKKEQNTSSNMQDIPVDKAVWSFSKFTLPHKPSFFII